MVNTDKLKQERELSKLDDTSRDVNPYRELLVNKAEKIETVLSQMEQWSVLSTVVRYVQYDEHPKNYHHLNNSTVNKEKYKRNSSKEEENKHALDLDFGDTPEKLKGETKGEILNTTRVDANLDLSTTYVGRIDMIKSSSIEAKGSFLMSVQGYTMEKIIRWNRMSGTTRYRS